MFGTVVAKTIIVLVVFPVIVHAVFTGAKMVVGSMLPSVVTVAGDWSLTLTRAVMGAAFLVGVTVSLSVCRRLWPTTAVAKRAEGPVAPYAAPRVAATSLRRAR